MPRVALIALLTTVAVVGSLSASVGVAATPRKVIASYCSPSGDVCYGVVNKSGAVYLEITTAARYFARYRLCVRPPGSGAAARWRCRLQSVRRTGSVWGSSVKFGGRFPYVGPGVYRARWSLGTRRLGPVLRFRLPLR
jgi:hypothetical protein